MSGKNVSEDNTPFSCCKVVIIGSMVGDVAACHFLGLAYSHNDQEAMLIKPNKSVLSEATAVDHYL